MNTPGLSSSPLPSKVPPAQRASVSVAPTETGCCIRVTGRGTVRESAAARDVAARTLNAGNTTVVVDLSACDYLDSTFLGCLTGLFTAYDRTKPHRFLIAAPPEVRKKLMGPCRLDKLLPFIDAAPAAAGPFVPVPAVDEGDSLDVARHVMTCHRALAEVDSPMRAAFTRIADQLEKELAGAAAPAGAGH